VGREDRPLITLPTIGWLSPTAILRYTPTRSEWSCCASPPTARDRYRWQEVEVLRQDRAGHVALGKLPEGDLSEGELGNGRLQVEWTEEAPPPVGILMG